MLCWVVVKREQDVLVFSEAVAGGFVLGSILFQELIERLVRSFACLGQPYLMQVVFRFGLNTLGKFVQDVRRLVNPAALSEILSEVVACD